jgi:hypothetical protein
MRMGPVKCYILSGAQNIQSMFKLRYLSSDKLERQIMTSVFGLSDHDLDVIQARARDDEGKASNTATRKRMYDVEKVYHNFLLAPDAVNGLVGKFMEVFGEALEKAPEIPPLPEKEDEEAEWATVNLYEWLRGHMFKASTTSFLGSRILEMNANLGKDYFTFDENMLKLVYGLPRFLASEGHQARDNLVDGAVKWLEDAERHGDIDNTKDWDPYFGSRFMMEKGKLEKKAGLPLRSRAGFRIAMLFA